jgi:hypothetical protein
LPVEPGLGVTTFVPCPVVPCPGGVDVSDGFGVGEFEIGGDELAGGLELGDSTTKIVIGEPCGNGEPVGGLVA